MENRLSFELREALEESFRRGYSHGFHDGTFTKKEDYKNLSSEIEEWRHDLTIQTTPPGSRFLKGVFVKWCDETELEEVRENKLFINRPFHRKFIQNEYSTKLTFEELLKKIMKEIAEKVEKCQSQK